MHFVAVALVLSVVALELPIGAVVGLLQDFECVEIVIFVRFTLDANGLTVDFPNGMSDSWMWLARLVCSVGYSCLVKNAMLSWHNDS